MDFPRKTDAVRILLVDDHPVVRAGLAITLGKVPGFTICGEAEGVNEAVSLIKTMHPDMVLVDLELESGSGLDVIRQTLDDNPELPVLMLSMHEESMYAERALRAGARGYLMKNESPANLVAAIRNILAGGIAISEAMKAVMLNKLVGGKASNKNPLDSLSDRELEVFREIGKGIGTRKIAEKMCLSVKTVETHISHIKRKLRIKDAAELQHHAFHHFQGEGRI